MKFIEYSDLYGHIARLENKFVVAVMPLDDNPPSLPSVTSKLRKIITISEDKITSGGVWIADNQNQATSIALAFEGVPTTEFYVKLYDPSGKSIWTNS